MSFKFYKQIEMPLARGVTQFIADSEDTEFSEGQIDAVRTGYWMLILQYHGIDEHDAIPDDIKHNISESLGDIPREEWVTAAMDKHDVCGAPKEAVALTETDYYKACLEHFRETAAVYANAAKRAEACLSERQLNPSTAA